MFDTMFCIVSQGFESFCLVVGQLTARATLEHSFKVSGISSFQACQELRSKEEQKSMESKCTPAKPTKQNKLVLENKISTEARATDNQSIRIHLEAYLAVGHVTLVAKIQNNQTAL